MMGKLVLASAGFAAAAVAIVALSGRSGDDRPGGRVADHDARVACIGRGVAYFRETGSWPRLGDGRDAFSVAEERCARTPTAF